MTTFIRTFQVNAGVIAADAVPNDQEDMYVTPDEMFGLFGCRPSEADIRMAQVSINAHCNRASLWPTLCQSPTLEIPQGRQETRLTVTPVISIHEVCGRFGHGRRDRQGWNSLYQAVNPLLILASTGRPQWSQIDVATVEVDASTGMLWLPWSSMLVPYNFIKVLYIAGYLEIPGRVKACINELINNFHQRGVSDRTRFTVGRISRGYASDSFLTPYAKELLVPFVLTSLM